MIKLNQTQKELAELLLKSVRDRRTHYTYKEIAEAVPSELHHRQVGYNIGEVSKLCNELELPLLSAKVVNGNTGNAGEGFKELAIELGYDVEGMTLSELTSKEKQAIRECKDWYKLQEYLGIDLGFSKENKNRTWILPANTSIFDCITCFNERKYIDWRENNNFQVNDIVYIYLANEPKKIRYKTRVKAIHIPFESYTDDKEYWVKQSDYEDSKCKQYFRIALIQDLENNGPSFKDLQSKGLKGNIQSAITIDNNSTLSEFIDSYFQGNLDSFEKDERADDELINEIDNNIYKNKAPIAYQHSPKLRNEEKITSKRKTYPRDGNVSANALSLANYQCELDPKHKTFLRKKSNLPYTEPHHLVPMQYQDDFKCSLDREQNIVSLCSNCHNEIHYGKNADKMICQLYEKRKHLLEEIGIQISLEKLLSYYKFK